MLKQSMHTFLTKAQGAFLCLCCFILPVSAALAQSNNDIVNRINRLENEIQTLNQAFYRGDSLPNPTSFAAPANIDPQTQANIEVRLQQMEKELRMLTGRIEEQGFEIQQLRSRVDLLTGTSAPPQAYVPPPQEQPAPYAAPAAGVPGSIAYTPPNFQRPLNPYELQPPATPQPQTQAAGLTASLPTDDPALLYEQSFALLKEGNYEASEQSFQKFLTTYPDHNLAPNATYWLGETFYVRNRYEEAAKYFAQSYAQYPNSTKSADNLLKLALSLGGQGKTADACVALRQLKSEFPNGPAAVIRRADQEISGLGCN